MSVTVNPNAVLGGVAQADAAFTKDSVRIARPQIIATRGCFPMAAAASGANNFLRWESAVAVKSGKYGASNVQVIYTNTYADGTHQDGFETLTPFALECSIVNGGRYNPVHFRGTRKPLVDNGGGLIISDQTTAGLSIPNTEVWVKTGLAVSAVVSAIALGTRAGTFGISDKTKKQATPLTASRIYSTEIFGTATNYFSQSFAPSPVAIIGIPSSPQLAIVMWGDSIASGQGDSGTSASGHCGFLERACDNVSGFAVPFSNLSRSSERTTAFSPTASPTRFAMFKYANHAIFAMGHNDITAGLTLASMQANCLVVWAAARAAGCKVHHCTISPKTTSTDAWATTANQAPVAGFTTAGLRGQFNAWLYEQVVAGMLDGVINSGVQGITPVGNPDVFIANATADGTHPSDLAHTTMAAVVNAHLLNLKV